MKPIDNQTLLHALNWRYATKAFNPDAKIDPAIWDTLERSLVLAPSSFGLQPWKFIVVSDPIIREALVPISWGQRQVADASHFVVFACKDPVTPVDVRNHIEHTAKIRGIAAESLAGFEQAVVGFITNPPYPLEMRAWATRQVYLALGSFMTAAALLGVDTCPMEGIDPSGYDSILGLNGSGFSTVVACAVGFRSDSDKYADAPKVRFPSDQVIQHIR